MTTSRISIRYGPTIIVEAILKVGHKRSVCEYLLSEIQVSFLSISIFSKSGQNTFYQLTLYIQRPKL